jgi:hypothetical protein
MEVSELVANDAAWWPLLCGEIAEHGLQAALREKESRGWAWGALWTWIVSNPERYGDYQRALEAFTQLKAHETIGIADEVEENKAAISKASLRVKVRSDFAGKADRGRWGDQVTHNVVVDDFGDLLRRVGERKLAAMKAEQNPAIDVTPTVVPEPTPALVAYETLDEI